MARPRTIHAVVGDFPDRAAARAVLVALRTAGVTPDRVSVVSGDPELARDVGGRSYTLAGFIGGAIVGVLLSVLFVVAGTGGLVNPVGVVIGGAGTVGGCAFIGLVVGRSLVRRSADAPVFEEDVRRGHALVTVECDGEACERARALLRDAGAADVRDEESAAPF